MTWATWLIGLVGPIVGRILAYLGIGIATFAGVDLVFGQLQSYAQSNWAGLPSAVLQLASLSYVPQALGLIFGAFNARLTLWIARASTQFIFKR